MSKVWITGENGFIARAFDRHLSHKHNVENSHLNKVYNYWRQNQFTKYHHKEINIFDPTLRTIIERSNIDLIIHTATTIENEEKSHNMVRQNVEGSYYVAQVAQELGIPVVLIQYDHHPNNKFMWTQRVITDMFRSMNVPFTQIITDELFGPEDFHGSISQLLMSSVGKLDQAKFSADVFFPQHYTFIDDFLDGLDSIISNIQNYKNKSISIKSSEVKTLENVLDYMANNMGITVQYDIIEEIKRTYSDLIETKLEGWKSKISFEAALEITRDIINDRRE